jgi:hypothetical protein
MSALFQNLPVLLGERIFLLALYVDCANDVLLWAAQNGNDDLRKRASKRGQVGSSLTLPTTIVHFCWMADPVSPLVTRKVGNAGAPGPLQATIDTSSPATS